MSLKSTTSIDTTKSNSNSRTSIIDKYRYEPQFDEMGYFPVQIKCPHCQSHIWTTVHDSYGPRTWIWMIVNFILCCCLSFAPLIIKSMKDVTHICPKCNGVVGKTPAFADCC